MQIVVVVITGVVVSSEWAVMVPCAVTGYVAGEVVGVVAVVSVVVLAVARLLAIRVRRPGYGGLCVVCVRDACGHSTHSCMLVHNMHLWMWLMLDMGAVPVGNVGVESNVDLHGCVVLVVRCAAIPS